jgi:hypothetical protein
MSNNYMIHRNEGNAVFVKETDFFVSQGGLVQLWGRRWRPIVAESIEDARSKGERLLPKYQQVVRMSSDGKPYLSTELVDEGPHDAVVIESVDQRQIEA